MSEPQGQPLLDAVYFDGRSARAQAVQIWLADGQLHVLAAPPMHYATRAVRWPERQRHGQRQALLPDGGVLSCSDARAWDDWASASGLRDSLVVRWMQSWRRVAVAAALLIAVVAASWRWGVPWAAERVLALLPASAEQQVGERALSSLDEGLLKPSKLSAERQQALAQRFERAAAVAAGVTGTRPAYRLHFRNAGKAVGPNAFALPGGEVVLTDALVELLADAPDAVVGVLAHELGHVQHRHGMRMVVQGTLTGVVVGLVLGDFSTVLAAAPALLVQQAYSRDFERKADEYSRQLLRGAGIPPSVMVLFFERVAKAREDKAANNGALAIAISSHPADEERIRFFRD